MNYPHRRIWPDSGCILGSKAIRVVDSNFANALLLRHFDLNFDSLVVPYRDSLPLRHFHMVQEIKGHRVLWQPFRHGGGENVQLGRPSGTTMLELPEIPCSAQKKRMHVHLLDESCYGDHSRMHPNPQKSVFPKLDRDLGSFQLLEP